MGCSSRFHKTREKCRLKKERSENVATSFSYGANKNPSNPTNDSGGGFLLFPYFVILMMRRTPH